MNEAEVHVCGVIVVQAEQGTVWLHDQAFLSRTMTSFSFLSSPIFGPPTHQPTTTVIVEFLQVR
jgi:hypothetical protein